MFSALQKSIPVNLSQRIETLFKSIDEIDFPNIVLQSLKKIFDTKVFYAFHQTRIECSTLSSMLKAFLHYESLSLPSDQIGF